MPKLNLYFAGTDQTWEDYAIFCKLGAQDRANIRDKEAKEFFHIFDGPASATSNQHLAVDKLYFDPNSPETHYMGSKGKSKLGHGIRRGRGIGLTSTRNTALDLMYHCIVNLGVREINLNGFSRGGVAALTVGACFNNLLPRLQKVLPEAEINMIKLTILAIDPVAGKSRNNEIAKLGPISKFVTHCTIALAQNEYIVGFEPRNPLHPKDRYKIKFESADTRFDVQLTTNDHLTAVVETQYLTHSQILQDSILNQPCPMEKLLKRRLGHDAEVKWDDKADDTRANRAREYAMNQAKYDFAIFPKDAAGKINFKQGIETLFAGLRTPQDVFLRAPSLSIQNVADSQKEGREFHGHKIGGRQAATKIGQKASAKVNTRHCNTFKDQYTNTGFVNLLHEAMFAKEYPRIHAYLLSRNEKDRRSAVEEVASIPKELVCTTVAISNAMEEGRFALKPFQQFKSSNYKNLIDLLAYHVKNEPVLALAEEKDDKPGLPWCVQFAPKPAAEGDVPQAAAKPKFV